MWSNISFYFKGYSLQNIGLFLGNMGLFLGNVRHCAEEKFEVRVGVCCGWNMAYYILWIPPFILPLPRASVLAKSFMLLLSYLSQVYAKEMFFSVIGDEWNGIWQKDDGKATFSPCDRKLFSLRPQTRSFFCHRFTALGRGFGSSGTVVWQMWQQKNNNPGVNTRARRCSKTLALRARKSMFC